MPYTLIISGDKEYAGPEGHEGPDGLAHLREDVAAQLATEHYGAHRSSEMEDVKAAVAAFADVLGEEHTIREVILDGEPLKPREYRRKGE